MEQNTKDNIFTFVAIVITFGLSLFFAINNYTLRRELKSARVELELTSEQLSEAANYNTELREQLNREKLVIEKSRNQLAELSDITSSSAGTIQECIQLVREIRAKVQDLENCLSGIDPNSNSQSNCGITYIIE